MAALKEKESSQPQSSAHGMQKPQAKYQNLDKADRDIAMRLEQLREKEKPKGKEFKRATTKVTLATTHDIIRKLWG